MYDSYSAARIREPLQLIPPVSSDPQGTDESERHPEAQRGVRQRVLVVEDEYLLSVVLTTDLQQAGYEVLGPCATLATALEAAQAQSFDGAILDINLRGELVYPVAEELARRGIPFLFLSGYAQLNIPEGLRSHPRLAKPAEWPVLLREVQALLRVKS